MSRVKICPKCGAIAEWDSYFGGTRCIKCDFVEKPKPTNADRIRAMTDEELARFIVRKYRCPDSYTSVFGPRCVEENGCEECWLEWLKEEDGT